MRSSGSGHQVQARSDRKVTKQVGKRRIVPKEKRALTTWQDQVPVGEAVIPAPTDSFVWRQDDYPLPRSVWNAHSEYEIHLIRNAEGTCYIGDHIGHFGPGDLFLIGPNLPHNWVTPLASGQSISGRDILLQFDGQKLLEAGRFLPELAQVKPLLLAAHRGLVFQGETRRAGARLLEDIEGSRGAGRLARFFELLDILSQATDKRGLSSSNFHPALDEKTNRILAEVFQHLAENLSECVRLSDAARIAGMSETSFSRFFKAKTGNTFSRHVSALRIGKACELLARTNMAVTEVSGAVGYDNLSNFNRSFRIVQGMTPSAYRRLART